MMEKTSRDIVFLEDYQPRSELVVAEHHVPKAKFPAIDAHNHITYPGFGWDKQALDQTLSELDYLNVAAVVNLSGEWGETLKRNLAILDQAYPGRFFTFCNINFKDIGAPF